MKWQHAHKQQWEKKVGVGHIYFMCTVASKLIMKIRGEKPVSGHVKLFSELKLQQ